MGSELFSLNEFADTWMLGITFGLMCVFVVGWLVLAVRLTALWKLRQLEVLLVESKSEG
jgi:hypothetical protein